MVRIKVPGRFCGKKPGDWVRLFFRTGADQLGEKIYERFYRVVKFYPFIVHCVDEEGYNRCFGYWEFRMRLSVKTVMRMK